jgi:hypothetical protein
MTFPTANMRLRDISLCLFTVGCNLHAALKSGGKRPDNRWLQLKILAGICARNSRHRAGLTQITCPALSRGFEQAAFLHVTAAKIVSIKVRALSPSRGSHSFIIDLEDKGTMSEQRVNTMPLAQASIIAGRSSNGTLLHTSDVLTRLCVHTDDITDLHKLWTVHFESCFGFDFLRHACRSIPANGCFSFYNF